MHQCEIRAGLSAGPVTVPCADGHGQRGVCVDVCARGRWGPRQHEYLGSGRISICVPICFFSEGVCSGGGAAEWVYVRRKCLFEGDYMY